jgi:hypothetical protein
MQVTLVGGSYVLRPTAKDFQHLDHAIGTFDLIERLGICAPQASQALAASKQVREWLQAASNGEADKPDAP